jgi:DNA-binding NarL/FixJ family response regulator
MSGFDVQARLREMGETIPVIVLTCHDTPEARERARQNGPAFYFGKPPDAGALIDALNTVINGQ